MASKPGILTDWPWKSLGSFKYLLLAPMAVHSAYSFVVKGEERDVSNFLIIPFMLFRALHNQFWISLSRYQTAKGSRRIIDKGLEFEQVDRESNWDDQIIMNGLIFYMISVTYPGAAHLPFWRTDGIILTILLHAGPVEFLYYWLHRALHHHYLYSRYHSHHHSSIVTQPITSVIHPFAETMAYFVLFAIPLLTALLTGTSSIMSFVSYVLYIDVMNNLGHCNFELIPNRLFSIFPPLKYLMYTPSFHSLHHTQFRTNYSLFMPIYDYMYNTVDKSSDSLHEASLIRAQESPDVVHLTHFTSWDSIYHLPVGFASLASRPHTSAWDMWLMWPVAWWHVVSSWFLGHKFIAERLTFNAVKSQTWVIPRYNIQYFKERQRAAINDLIEESIIEAEERGVKVLSLGLLNQEKELNGCGELYIRKHPQLKLKIVDGSSLVAAVVLNSIPSGTTEVLLRGKLTKVAFAIASTLCKRAIKVGVVNEDEYKELSNQMGDSANVMLTRSHDQKIWLTGDGFTEKDQLRASTGTLFIPFVQFPHKKMRKDCLYHNTPALIAPKSLENMNSCENWLPRRVMSAWRAAGILHALEGWNVNECGNVMFEMDKVWEASLRHGFRLLSIAV